jgi:small subunit ribosomal protein S20
LSLIFNEYKREYRKVMASHKSAKKRIRTNARKKMVNMITESRIKTHVKKVMNSTEKEEAEKLYKEAIAILDRNSAKGTIHKNTASRKKAALTRHLNSLSQAK